MNYFPYLSGYKKESLGEYEKSAFNFLYANKKLNIPTYMKHYFMNKQLDSISTLKKSKKLSADELYSLAFLLKKEKKISESIIWFKKYLELKPKDEIARYQLGDAFWGINAVEDAVSQFQQILKDNPRNYEAAANLGFINLQNENAKEAQILSRHLACMLWR